MESRDNVLLTLKEIAEYLRGTLTGPPDRAIRAVRPVADAGPDDITFVDDPKYLSQLNGCRAAAVIVARDVRVTDGPALLHVDHPSVAFVQLLKLFYPNERPAIGVSRHAHVAEECQIGPGVNVFPGAYVGRGVRIGEDTDIYPGVFLGDDVSVGRNCTLYSNVSVYPRCELGDRVILHAGVVIGADGFGYTLQEQENAEEPVTHLKVPQVGRVVIEDDVEVGANSTIDRAALATTRVSRGTKIDNLVMIAHNCDVGRHNLLVSQVGISGSTKLGDYVTVAGQAGIVGHITIGDGATIGAQSGVTKNVAAKATVLGSPAMDGGKFRRAIALMQHLPEYRQRISELEKRLERLEERLKHPEG